MKKFLAFGFIVCLAPLIAGLYGILHDQLTYSISHEYYTKFKFLQFGIIDKEGIVVSNPRLQVCVVGFLATWWMGPPIAITLALTNLSLPTAKQLMLVSLKAMLATMIVAFITGLAGLLYGLNNPEIGNDWWLPETIEDKAHFVAVGSMHNFSYLGGLIGLIAGIVYSIRQRAAI